MSRGEKEKKRKAMCMNIKKSQLSTDIWMKQCSVYLENYGKKYKNLNTNTPRVPINKVFSIRQLLCRENLMCFT
jgi:hypothetical protein